jgi:hypothetical protein
VARGGPLLVKDLAGASRAPQVLDFDAPQVHEIEARLSQLARWVVQLERSSAAFGLRLPGMMIAPAAGRDQRRRCLTALARYGVE